MNVMYTLLALAVIALVLFLFWRIFDFCSARIADYLARAYLAEDHPAGFHNALRLKRVVGYLYCLSIFLAVASHTLPDPAAKGVLALAGLFLLLGVHRLSMTLWNSLNDLVSEIEGDEAST